MAVKKQAKKKKVAKKAAPPKLSLNHELIRNVTSQPLSSIAMADKVRMPLHACLDNGPGAKCTLMRYNPRSNQYDIDEGDIDCNLCTHIIQPTQ